MSKHNRRNRAPLNKVDFRDVKAGLYLDERSFGNVHLLNEYLDENKEKMYVYRGKLHNGEISLLTGENLKTVVPSFGYDHGWTLEGEANALFVAENALVRYNEFEHRTFCYNNETSKLMFVGNPSKQYELHIHVYDNCHGTENNRWVVIWAATL